MYFAIAYLTQGIAAQFGLIAQPIQFFMMKGLNLSAAEVSSYLAIMMLPWVVKPFYGLVCDFVPLFGYRRKSYLIAAHVMTAIAFIVMALSSSLNVILASLLVTAAGMSVSTALMVGLAVEEGRDTGKVRDYFGWQIMCYHLAHVGASLVGGMLCQALAPMVALHWAALLAMLPVLAVSVLTATMLKEERTRLDREKMQQTWSSLVAALRSRPVWVAAAIMWFWNFSPALGVPLYYFESKTLGFSQTVIGQLAAWNAGGMLLGTLVYAWLFKKMPLRRQLMLAVLIGTVTTLTYLGLVDPVSATVIELARGTASMIALLALYSLCGEVCPRRIEVSVMALLLAARNLGTEASTYVGGQLFTHVFHDSFWPLVLTATACTAFCAAFIPMVPAGKESR